MTTILNADDQAEYESDMLTYTTHIRAIQTEWVLTNPILVSNFKSFKATVSQIVFYYANVIQHPTEIWELLVNDKLREFIIRDIAYCTERYGYIPGADPADQPAACH